MSSSELPRPEGGASKRSKILFNGAREVRLLRLRLAMTAFDTLCCHCEERSDEAISSLPFASRILPSHFIEAVEDKDKDLSSYAGRRFHPRPQGGVFSDNFHKRVAERIQCIILLHDGKNAKQVAEILMVSVKTIKRWIKIFVILNGLKFVHLWGQENQ